MALFKFSSRSSARHSGAQLRLAPNRPCMTLVMFIIILYVWYVRHARTAIDIVQRCAVYFKRPLYRSKQKAPKEDTLSEIEPVISSIAQGPAKNTIKID